jgi:hypothetical protein
VTYEMAIQGDKGGQVVTSRFVMTVELSDYGVPVDVERPTDVIVGGRRRVDDCAVLTAIVWLTRAG